VIDFCHPSLYKHIHGRPAFFKNEIMTMKAALSTAWKKGLGLALILIIAAGLRIQHIKADPPLILPALSGSAGVYFDEGIYCHNARNKILFGRWIMDEWNPLVYNAPLTLIYFLGFKLFGISIVTVKVINILFSLLGILLFHAGLRTYVSSGQALALSGLFALDFYGLMYNRIGLLENFSSLCFLLSFFLFVRARGRHGLTFVLGLTVTLTALSKYLFLYFLISTLLAIAYQARRRSDLRLLVSFLAGGLAVGLPWFFGIYLPFRTTFSKIGSGWGMLSLPRSFSQVWSNLVHNPLARYFQLLPTAALLLILFGGLMLVRFLRSKGADRLRELDFFIFLWIAGAVLSMGILNYRPLRYYLPMWPALYLAISLLIKDRDWIRTQSRWFWPLALIPAALFIPLFGYLTTRPSAFFIFPLVLRAFIYLSLAGVVLYFIVRPPALKRYLEGLVLAVMLGTSLFLYVGNFYLHPTYQLEAASRYLETLPPGSVLMGQEALRLTLGTPVKALMTYENWFNDEDLFVRYQPTHLIVLDKFGDMEMGWIKRKYPEIAPRLDLVRKFPVWNTTMSLYRVQE
jgi:4-amino-4-deoxy-L-arabinose transferase-like glycosyltransferase